MKAAEKISLLCENETEEMNKMKGRRLIAVLLSLLLLGGCASVETPVSEPASSLSSPDDVLDQFFSDLAVILLDSGLLPAEPGEPASESAAKRYPSIDSAKELFLANKSAFFDFVRLAQENEEFFFQNDNGMVATRPYEYAAYFDESEWQSIKSFFALSGSSYVLYENIWVKKNGNERCGKQIAIPFFTSQPGVHCYAVYLSSLNDWEMKLEMKTQWLRIYGRHDTIEMEELGDGWFWFTHYELPDDP